MLSSVHIGEAKSVVNSKHSNCGGIRQAFLWIHS